MSFKAEKIAGMEGAKATLDYISLFKRTSLIFSVLVTGIGIFVLFGYIFNITLLKSFLPGSMTMRVNAAFCFILTGAAMFLLQENEIGEMPAKARRNIGYCLLAVIAIFAIIPMCEYIFSVNITIDDVILNAISAGSYSHSMPANVAFNFVLISMALLTLDFETKKGFRPAQAFIIVELLIGLLGFVTYIYGEQEMFGIAAQTKMAFHSSIEFLLVGTGILFSRPASGLMTTFISDSYDGLLARLVIPASIVFFLLYGIVVLAGQEAGFYGTQFRLALTSTTSIAIAAALIFAIARLFHLMEASQRRMSAKQDLVSYVSHKLFTPLSVIIGLADLEDSGAYGKLDDKMKKAVESIRENALKMQSMIEKLLTLAKINVNDPNLMTEDLVLEEELKKAADEVISQNRDKKVIFSVQAADPNIRMKMNRPYFELIAYNIIENAVKFNDKGICQISCSVEKSAGSVKISFADNGPGIPPEETAKIFDGFYQIEKTFTGRVEGIGVGLSVVKRMVEAHGGTISVGSTPGKGATFLVTLPLTKGI